MHKWKLFVQYIKDIPKKIKKYVLISILPIVLASTVSTIWANFHSYLGEPYSHNDTKIWIASLIGLIYTFLANKLFDNATVKIQKMQGAINQKQEEKFFSFLRTPLSPAIHFFVAVTALCIIYHAATYRYETVRDGAEIIFTLTFVFSLFFMIIIDIVNVFGGCWALDITRLPPEWVDEIIEFMGHKKWGRLNLSHLINNGNGHYLTKCSNKKFEESEEAKKPF